MLRQATCVAIAGRGLLIEGPPGSGKSSLALALLDRGAVLVGDDGVDLAAAGGRLLASPAPLTAGLLEIRNVGIVRRPYGHDIPVCLVVNLAKEAGRLPERAEEWQFAGVTLPLIRLWPGAPVLPLRAEAALDLHGLGLSPGGAGTGS